MQKGIIPWVGNICGCSNRLVEGGYIYSNGTVSSPDCILHTAVTHVITVLEQQSHMQILMEYGQVSFANTHITLSSLQFTAHMP